MRTSINSTPTKTTTTMWGGRLEGQGRRRRRKRIVAVIERHVGNGTKRKREE